MGSVWLARHLALDAPVAIKLMNIEGGDPERFHARFEREARLAASVRHRNVVSITDYGYMADGTAFMVMDYLAGQPFSAYLETRPPTAEVLYLVELTVRGLVAVHEAGIVHRDLKPENIFVVRDATGVYPKLIDFGISKHLRPEGGRRSAVTTQAGAILGTPAYMSPEQARGLPDIDQRTDIYSIGVILYEALSGHVPYESPYVADLMLAIVLGGATPLHELRPDLDPRVCDVVMKAMAHDPLTRYQSARDLLAALSALSPSSGDIARSDRPPIMSPAPSQVSFVLPGVNDAALSRELTFDNSQVPEQVLAAADLASNGARRARLVWGIGLAALAIVGLGVAAGAVWFSTGAAPEPGATVRASSSAGAKPKRDERVPLAMLGVPVAVSIDAGVPRQVVSPPSVPAVVAPASPPAAPSDTRKRARRAAHTPTRVIKTLDY